MKAVIQRVSESSVTIKGKITSSIGHGMMVLIGIEDADNIDDVKWLSNKIVNLRIFEDTNSVMNLSILDKKGEILVISQFTLQASTKKGNRPSYIKAAKPEVAIPLYNSFVDQLDQDLGTKVQTGEFGADMKIHLINDGPVTIMIDSKNKT